MNGDSVEWDWVVAVGLMVAVVAANIALPALVVVPLLGSADRLASGEVELGQVAQRLPAPWSGWVAAACAAAAAAIAVRHMLVERMAERRWMILAAAAGAGVLWSLATAAALGQAARVLAGAG